MYDRCCMPLLHVEADQLVDVLHADRERLVERQAAGIGRPHDDRVARRRFVVEQAAAATTSWLPDDARSGRRRYRRSANVWLSPASGSTAESAPTTVPAALFSLTRAAAEQHDRSAPGWSAAAAAASRRRARRRRCRRRCRWGGRCLRNRRPARTATCRHRWPGSSADRW